MANIEEHQLQRLEREFQRGISSAELLDTLASFGVQLSEASLRKYVQLGLLPRSVRVGRKGKHQGSQGLYPIGVARQILLIKQMMAQSYTMEQIRKDFLFVRTDLYQLEQSLSSIFRSLTEVLRERRNGPFAQDVQRDVEGARKLSQELVSCLEEIESRLTTRAKLRRVSSL